MPYNIYNLPPYPCESDMWDSLQKETRPIVIYGMGNGADKLFRRLDKYGITVADVFASDGFVRGHSYNGFFVKTFSQIKEQYSDFVILLSFASNREEVIEMLSLINSEYDMYVPDMPIADETEYFDREFYNKNYDEILEAYNSLCDEESRAIYSSVVNYRLTGRLNYLLECFTEKSEMYRLLNKKDIKTCIDVGAYCGDTAKEAIEYFPSLEKIYAIEPDKKNYKRLLSFAKNQETEIITYNAAAYSKIGVGSFSNSGNRNSAIEAKSTASFENKTTEVEFITVDSLSPTSVDYIKYDVEGAEYDALLGTEKTIIKHAPALLISLYHRSRDIFYLTCEARRMYNNYDLYIRRLRCVPAWELNLIMLPKEK